MVQCHCARYVDLQRRVWDWVVSPIAHVLRTLRVCLYVYACACAGSPLSDTAGDTGAVRIGNNTNVQDRAVVIGGHGPQNRVSSTTHIGHYCTIGTAMSHHGACFALKRDVVTVGESCDCVCYRATQVLVQLCKHLLLKIMVHAWVRHQ